MFRFLVESVVDIFPRAKFMVRMTDGWIGWVAGTEGIIKAHNLYHYNSISYNGTECISN